jgi:hypothetical protein
VLDEIRTDAQGERGRWSSAAPGGRAADAYVLEGWTSARCSTSTAGEVLNCSVTSYLYDEAGRGRWRSSATNEAAPLEEQDEQVTAEPDAGRAPR